MKKSFIVILFSIILVIFNSCTNFFNGSDFKDQLNTKIDYVNSDPVTVRVTGAEKAISFISGNGNNKLKKTDTLIIEFKLDTSKYDFAGWNIYQKDTDTDCSQKIKCVTTHTENLYKTTITLLEASCDIVMDANCYQLPAVETFTPAYYPTGIFCYQNIVITFTQPMKAEQLSDFSNVSITNLSNENLNDYFNPPILVNGKTLIIKPIPSKIETIFSENSIYDIKVKLSSSLKTADDSPYPFKEFESIYRINTVPDSNAPVLNESDLTIQKKVMDFETNTTYKAIIDNKEYTDWTTENGDYNNHLVNDTIIISAKGTNLNGGIKSLLIKESILKSWDGSDNISSIEPVEAGDFMQSADSKNEYYCNDFEYKIHTPYDGLIKLEISLINFSDFESDVITYYVIKHSSTKEKFQLNCDYTYEIGGISVNDATPNYIRMPDEDGKDHIPFHSFQYKDIFYTENSEPQISRSKITVSYFNEETEPILLETFTGNQNTTSFYAEDKTVIVNPKIDTYFKYTIETELGLKTEHIVTFPKAITPGKVTVTKDNGIYLNIEENGSPLKKIQYVLYYKKNINDAYEFLDASAIFNSPIELPRYFKLPSSDNYYYKLCTLEPLAPSNPNDFYNDYIFSCAVYPIEFKVSATGTIESIETNNYSSTLPKFTATSESNGPNSGTYKVKINYTQNGDSNHNYKVFCTYKYKVWDEDKTIYLYPEVNSNNEFDLTCGYEYQLGISTVDSYGYELSRTTTGYPKLDLTKLNNPLSKILTAEFKKSEYSPNSIKLQISSNSQNYEKIRNKTYTLKYYVDKSNTIDETELVFPSNEQLKKLQEFKQTFTIPTNFGTERNYYYKSLIFINPDYNSLSAIYGRLYDENGNYTEVKMINNPVLNKTKTPISLQNYQVKTSSETQFGIAYTHYELSFPVENMAGPTYATPYNTTTKQWDIPISFYNSIYNNNLAVNLGDTVEEYNKYKDSFWRIQVSPYSENIKQEYYKSYFVNPAFFFGNNKSLTRKQIVVGLVGYNISTNKPTLIRTLYSKYNYGNDADLWATCGMENDVQIVSTDTMYEAVTEGIPKNYYYCVVITFADSSTYMGEVKIQE